MFKTTETNEKKARIWFVDDLPSNRKSFEKAHEHEWSVTTFGDIGEVQRRLEYEEPDALLCDIFFYPGFPI